ncbi:MAG: hypothetical protein M8364_14140 [Methylobacter sp.]|uniref:hypothetical protein n=1 Tax=Methylobacter sp. TaxID=2051955 RepID=UPI00258A0C31|nr:hypothetical protein [Methylobacter sp.]MCL7422035.1 hypothetical protein [Methylobacter sp.]
MSKQPLHFDKPQLDGQQLAKICKTTLPDDEFLLAKIQALIPDYPVRLATIGEEWYRLGGIVDITGKRIAANLIEWAERTFIECGRDLQTLIDHTLAQNLIATRQTGNTLYVVIQTGSKAEDFIQLEIDKTHEVSDRLLVSPRKPPEDLEEFIDPLEPEWLQTFSIGTARYTYRRKTDVPVFMDEINKYHTDEHPAQRFMHDWNRSSAGPKAVFSNDWIIRPHQTTGRFGEQIISVEIFNTQNKNIPRLDDVVGKKGNALNNTLKRFDRQAGYPFAWFFHMLKGQLVSPRTGIAVFQDISGDFAYLPARDAAVLKDWIEMPYSV